MAAIPINLTIPANKNLNDEAELAFVKVFPNTTADPASPDFVDPPGPSVGLTDAEWVAERTRQWLNDIINTGKRRVFDEGAPADDPDIVE